MLGEVEREFGDGVREIVDLDAVKLREVYSRIRHAVHFQEDGHLQAAQFFVGDDEEIARSAGGVEEFYAGYPMQKVVELFLVSFAFLERFFEVVQKEWLDDFHDIGHGGVVHAQGCALARVRDGLHHGAEDVRIDEFPVELSAFDDDPVRFGGECRYPVRFFEKSAVDIREFLKMVREVVRSVLFFGIEHGEKLSKVCIQVFSVRLGVRGDGISEDSLLEYVGILGEEAEKKPREEDVQVMRSLLVVDIVFVQDDIVELSHFLGSFPVGRVLVLVLMLFDARPGEEKVVMLGDILYVDVERFLVFGFGIDRQKRLVVGGDNKARIMSHGLRIRLQHDDGFMQVLAVAHFLKEEFFLEDDLAFFFGKVVTSFLKQGYGRLRKAVSEQQFENELLF